MNPIYSSTRRVCGGLDKDRTPVAVLRSYTCVPVSPVGRTCVFDVTEIRCENLKYSGSG